MPITLQGSVTFGQLSGGTGALSLGGPVSLAGSVVLAADVRVFVATGTSQTGSGRSLAKTGAASLTLSGANTYTGSTTVSNGTLVLNGSLSGPVLVEGGVFKGNGTVSNNVTVNHGIHAPGASLGVIKIKGNYTLAAGATLQIEINGTAAGAQYDQVILSGGSGTVTLAGTLQLLATNNLPVGSSFIIITNTGTAAVSGAFAGLPQGFAFYSSGYWWRINYSGGSGNEVVLTIIPPPAPALTAIWTNPPAISLVVTGEAGHYVDIYASSNLTHWTWLTGSFNPGGVLYFSDLEVTNQPARFYRAVLLP